MPVGVYLLVGFLYMAAKSFRAGRAGLPLDVFKIPLLTLGWPLYMAANLAWAIGESW